MCGICGKLEFAPERSVDAELLRQMAGAIVHRGPDGEGFFVSGQIGLGHRRLSIIDLATGNQPLSNENGTVWTVFNGEIYNYRELREFLISKGHSFRTASDTEVLVHLYEQFGTEMLGKLRGMFAFAIWDNNTRTLFLARDRAGIKPLYYVKTSSALLFASEIKSLLVDESVKRELNPQAVDTFLTFSYVPGAETLLRNVFKLLPGHYLVAHDGSISVRPYWDLQFAPSAENGRLYKEELEDLLRDTVRGHLISDVPVGVLLSGGVDSTAMLSFASECINDRLHSFTIGFSGHGVVDERPYARLASRHFGTEHHETTISAQDFADFLPHYVWHMEEPVCEPPAVALFYVSKLAREYVKVLISGEGGDEAFAGYPEYRNFPFFENWKRRLGPFKNLAGVAASTLSRLPHFPKLKKYAPLISIKAQDYYLSRTALPTTDFHRNLNRFYTPEFQRKIDHRRTLNLARSLFQNVAGQPLLNQLLYIDTKTWLPDDLLIKADKITMANSIELRVPLLDHRVLEFAAALPLDQKMRGSSGKHILRTVLSGRVPQEILTRKKAGFPVPYGNWLDTELKSMAHDTLFSRRARERGYFQPGAVDKALTAGNPRARSKYTFSLLTFELWNQTFLDNRAVPSDGDKPTVFDSEVCSNSR